MAGWQQESAIPHGIPVLNIMLGAEVIFESCHFFFLQRAVHCEASDPVEVHAIPIH
jgi:hypothetical protein